MERMQLKAKPLMADSRTECWCVTVSSLLSLITISFLLVSPLLLFLAKPQRGSHNPDVLGTQGDKEEDTTTKGSQEKEGSIYLS